jgi:hypothetical protein
MKLWITIYALLVLLSACAYRVEKEAQVAGAFSSSIKIDFQAVQSEILRPRCVACHAQYDTYPDVKRDLAAILDSVDKNRMPKTGGPLSSALKKLLADWAAAGAPEAIGESPITEPPVQIEPNWDSLSRYVIGPKCALCHNPNGQAKFLDLSSREAIWNARDGLFPGAPKLLDFENPAQSYLFEVMRDPTGPMPPPASGISAVSDDELVVLQEWVRLGIP